MDLLTTLALAVGLGMDAFAASLAAGGAIGRVSPRQMFRLAWHFGFFQFAMPVLGWAAGLTVVRWVEAFDHWVALALLSLVGGHMVWEAFHVRDGDAPRRDPTRGATLVVLSVATSIDALAVGFALAAQRISIWKPAAIIGCVCFLMAVSGMGLGDRASRTRLGRWADALGGLILIGIGVRILVSHLTA